MLDYYANIYAYPSDASEGPPLVVRGVELAPLKNAAGVAPIFDAYLPVTFEAAYDALVKLPRLDAEPDGFFVIAGDADGRRWQLDGHLFDFGGRLHRVELHGECPAANLDLLLKCLGWPGQSLAFELIKEGIVLAEPAFRAYAGAPT